MNRFLFRASYYVEAAGLLALLFIVTALLVTTPPSEPAPLEGIGLAVSGCGLVMLLPGIFRAALGGPRPAPVCRPTTKTSHNAAADPARRPIIHRIQEPTA